MSEVTRSPGTTTFHWPSGTPFDSGALCLDLVYTGGPGDLAKWERLRTADDLRRWVRDGPVGLPIASVRTVDLETMLTLREHLRSLLYAASRAGLLPERAVAAVNGAAASPPPVPRLSQGGSVRWATPITAAQVGSLLARDAIGVLRDVPAGRLRECAAADCALLFLDDSRAGSRRWCSMQRCGNRSKVRAQRARS